MTVAIGARVRPDTARLFAQPNPAECSFKAAFGFLFEIEAGVGSHTCTVAVGGIPDIPCASTKGMVVL